MFKLVDGNTTNERDENSDCFIGTQPTIMACNNYQVSYFANKSIAWCGDGK